MARPKAKDEKTSTGGGLRRDKVSEAEAQLRAYHALGLAVRARAGVSWLDGM